MRFNSPHLLWLLLALPAAVALGWWLQRRKTRRWRKSLDQNLESIHFAERSNGKQGVKTALFLLGFVLCVLSLARPQYGASTVKQTRRGLDMVIAVDVSKSMLAKDLLPDRLTRAKLELSSLLDKLRGDRVGFIAFSGQAFIQCPLTNDYTAAKVFLRALDTKTIPRGGTAIAEALRTADQLLDDARQHGGAKSQIVVVMTDGEDHEGDALAAAKALHEKGVNVFTVGVGSTVGEPIPVYSDKNEFRGYMKDSRGNTVLSKVNEEALKGIADAGGGRYVASNAGSTGVEELLSDLAGFEREEHEAKFKVVYTDRFQWVLVPGALFLVLGMLLSPRRAAALAILLYGSSADAFPWPSLQNGDVAKANESLEAGNADEAIKGYEAVKETLGDRPELYLNEGIAQLKKNDPKAARPLLERALLSEDKTIRGKAQYLLGNASFDEKDFSKAVEHYKKSLREEPKAKDTKHNLELAQALLKQQKEQQKKDDQKKDDQKKDDKEKDKDKKDEDKKDEKKDDKEQQQKKDDKEEKKPEPKPGEDKKPEPKDDKEAQKQPSPSEQQQQQQQQQQQEKQPNERMQLLDALQAEEKPMRFDLFKAQQQKKAQRRTVEKDW